MTAEVGVGHRQERKARVTPSFLERPDPRPWYNRSALGVDDAEVNDELVGRARLEDAPCEGEPDREPPVEDVYPEDWPIL